MEGKKTEMLTVNSSLGSIVAGCSLPFFYNCRFRMLFGCHICRLRLLSVVAQLVRVRTLSLAGSLSKREAWKNFHFGVSQTPGLVES